MAKYSIERLSLSNIKHLQTLYRAAFERNISLNVLIKKYNTKVFGVEFIGYLAMANDSPAAFYGVLPCHFQLKGERILAAQSGDTMTHPDHRRESLFLRLATETYSLAKKNNIQFIFGFPNQNSFRGLVKLNWEFQQANMKLFRFHGNLVPFAKILIKVPFIYDLYTSFFRGQTIPRNINAALYQSSDGVRKDRLFIDYKTYSENYFIRIDGALVWIKLNGSLKVGFAAAEEISTQGSFIKKLRRIAILCGCREVIYMTSINTPLYKMLSQYAKPEDSFPIGFYRLTDRAFDFSNVQFEYCDIDIF
ncbi:MAG: GNAT family N-acetyltransferase [Cyclobacteriaceae bacterium]